MRILYITYSLVSGGAERLVVDLTNELSDNLNDEVHLMTIRSDDDEKNTFYKKDVSERVIYHNQAIDYGFGIKKLRKLHKGLKSINPDVVHFHGRNIVLFFVFAIFFFRKPKYFETLHNAADEVITLKNFSFISIPIYKLKLVSLIAISHANYRSIRDRIKMKNIPIIYNGRAIDDASGPSEDAANEMKIYEKSPNEIIFIHAGRCVEQKNQQLMINAFNEVSLKYPLIRLFIFGEGFDSRLGEYLISISCDRIHFMGPKQNLLGYMRYADAFLLSSIYEGMPISLIEALACNTVPICTPTSGAIDVIKNGINGFLSDDFSLPAYRKSLEEYLESDTTGFEKAMMDTYIDYFTIESCVQKYYDLYAGAHK